MKFKTALIAIQARSTSARLPEKCFQMVGEKMVLEHVVDAAKNAAKYMNWLTSKNGIVVKVALLIPHGDKIDSEFRKKIRVVQGSEDDVLSRYQLASEMMECDYICRITGDCPLIQDWIISKHITYAAVNEYDYVGNGDERLRTAIDGMDCEVISAKLLKHIDEQATRKDDREHVTLMARRERDALKGLGFKYGISMPRLDLSDIKLSVDTEEDLDRIRSRYLSGEIKYTESVGIYGKQHVHRY